MASIMNICSNDKTIMKDLVRIKKSETGIKLQTCWITWSSPSTPKSHWHTVEILPANSSRKAVYARKQALLDNKRYFMVCNECGERNPIGWMCIEDGYCQGCAEKNHGVVF